MSVKENSSSRSDKIRLERNWKRLKSTEILLDVAERTPRPSGGISFNKEFVLASTDGINYERESISRFLDAEDLYISACSSEETIAFYRAMGSSLASNTIKEIAEAEPFDLQMICSVKN